MRDTEETGAGGSHVFNITADIFRAVITGVIFIYLQSLRGKEPPRLQKAWIFFIIGFGLLFWVDF